MATKQNSTKGTQRAAKKAEPARAPSAARKTMNKSLGSLVNSLRQSDSTVRVVELPIDQIAPDPDQARRSMDKKKLESLAASILSQGVQVPIRVYTQDDATTPYLIRYGERRWRAAKMAGLSTIPAMIGERDAESDRNRLTEQVTENLQREDMNLHDTVMAVCQIAAAQGNGEAATALGMPKSWVSMMVSIGGAGGVVSELLQSGVTKDVEALYVLASIEKKDAEVARVTAARVLSDNGERARTTVKAAYDGLVSAKQPAGAGGSPPATEVDPAPTAPDDESTGAEPAAPGDAAPSPAAEPAGTSGVADGKGGDSTPATPGNEAPTTPGESPGASPSGAADGEPAPPQGASPKATRTRGDSLPSEENEGAAQADDGVQVLYVQQVEFRADGSVLVRCDEQQKFVLNGLMEKLGVE